MSISWISIYPCLIPFITSILPHCHYLLIGILTNFRPFPSGQLLKYWNSPCPLCLCLLLHVSAPGAQSAPWLGWHPADVHVDDSEDHLSCTWNLCIPNLIGCNILHPFPPIILFTKTIWSVLFPPLQSSVEAFKLGTGELYLTLATVLTSQVKLINIR